MDLNEDIKLKCEWCKSNINQKVNIIAGLKTKPNVYFCDIVCAKIYHDTISKLTVKEDNFRKAYITKILKEREKKLYEKIATVSFEFLPRMHYGYNFKDDAEISPKMFKEKCLKLILAGI